MHRHSSVGNVAVTVTGVAVGVGEASMTGGIGSARRDTAEGTVPEGAIPSPRTAADAYRVSDDDLRRARLVVARNSADSDDLREMLDMLGLISSSPDLPPPVSR